MAESIPSLKSFKGNKLPVHGNERTMNLNHLILANITESAYFRTDLVQHRSYDDMIDEIYYRVQHLEPWEKVFITLYCYRGLHIRLNHLFRVAQHDESKLLISV